MSDRSCGSRGQAPCQHNFCLECLGKWTGKGNKACPTCRSKLPSTFMANPRINTALTIAIRIARQGNRPTKAEAGPVPPHLARNVPTPPDLSSPAWHCLWDFASCTASVLFGVRSTPGQRPLCTCIRCQRVAQSSSVVARGASLSTRVPACHQGCQPIIRLLFCWCFNLCKNMAALLPQTQHEDRVSARELGSGK